MIYTKQLPELYIELQQQYVQGFHTVQAELLALKTQSTLGGDPARFSTSSQPPFHLLSNLGRTGSIWFPNEESWDTK